jgi:hypothetical protein
MFCRVVWYGMTPCPPAPPPHTLPQTLFVKCLPRATVSRVWECFFVEGTSFLFRAALALVDLLAPHVLGKGFEDTIQILTVSPVRKGVWALINDGTGVGMSPCVAVQYAWLKRR